jgi:hypothetical protein
MNGLDAHDVGFECQGNPDSFPGIEMLKPVRPFQRESPW